MDDDDDEEGRLESDLDLDELDPDELDRGPEADEPEDDELDELELALELFLLPPNRPASQFAYHVFAFCHVSRDAQCWLDTTHPAAGSLLCHEHEKECAGYPQVIRREVVQDPALYRDDSWDLQPFHRR